MCGSQSSPGWKPACSCRTCRCHGRRPSNPSLHHTAPRTASCATEAGRLPRCSSPHHLTPTPPSTTQHHSRHHAPWKLAGCPGAHPHITSLPPLPPPPTTAHGIMRHGSWPAAQVLTLLLATSRRHPFVPLGDTLYHGFMRRQKLWVNRAAATYHYDIATSTSLWASCRPVSPFEASAEVMGQQSSICHCRRLCCSWQFSSAFVVAVCMFAVPFIQNG